MPIGRLFYCSKTMNTVNHFYATWSKATRAHYAVYKHPGSLLDSDPTSCNSRRRSSSTASRKQRNIQPVHFNIVPATLLRH